MTLEAANEPDSAELRKARGAFFTPPELAAYVTEWAVRSGSDRVLEPSCGEAAFLLPAADRLTTLGAVSGKALPEAALHGVELHEESAESARALLRDCALSSVVVAADFFTIEPNGAYDAVVGNPPYIRYQDFAGSSRALSRAAALRAGVSLTGLASSWAAFTVHAALFLKRGGRLGLVLPAELLSVNYAADVRRFLMERFASVDLVMFSERVFPGVLEEVVLLLADGYGDGPAHRMMIRQARNASELACLPLGRTWRPERPEDKWTPSLLSAEALGTYSSLSAGAGFTCLEEWGDTTLGMVTGNNRYFAVSPSRKRELGLTSTDVIRLSPPGSRHLRGLSLTRRAFTELGRAGASTYLFRPTVPSPAAWEYIAAGESAGVHSAYKCRVRTPWWRVPLVEPADILLTYMNADTPRLVSNEAQAHHLNSVHGLYLRPQYQSTGRRLLPLASLNSMTMLGAETVGRAYGGGLLKLEPREADRLPVPHPTLIMQAEKGLAAVKDKVARLLRGGKLRDAARLIDDVLLVGELGVRPSDVRVLREAYAELAARRAARGGPNGAN